MESCTPYPGTLAYEEYKEKLTTLKYKNYDQTNLVFNHKNLTKQIIDIYLPKAYVSFLFNKLRNLFFQTFNN